MNKTKICPYCKMKIETYPAISRVDNKTEICSECGMEEAIRIYKSYLEKRKKNE